VGSGTPVRRARQQSVHEQTRIEFTGGVIEPYLYPIVELYSNDGFAALASLFDSHLSVPHSSVQLFYAVDAFLEADKALRAGNIADISEEQRRWVLDFPGLGDQERRRMEITSLTLDQLWTKATDTPLNLSDLEADFLVDRYWTNITSEERQWLAKAPHDLVQGRYCSQVGGINGTISLAEAQALSVRYYEVQQALTSPREFEALHSAQNIWGERRRTARI